MNEKRDVQMQLREGLSFLVRQSGQINRLLHGSGKIGSHEIPTILKDHPFGLSIPGQPEGWSVSRTLWRGIQFMGYPGYTEVSVNTMATYIAYRLTLAPIEVKIPYLRVILTECDPKLKHHRVYYEIMIAKDILMCGGCTDHSGGGGYGKQLMDALFAVLSRLFEMEVQTVTIPFAKAQKMERLIRNAVDDFNK